MGLGDAAGPQFIWGRFSFYLHQGREQEFQARRVVIKPAGSGWFFLLLYKMDASLAKKKPAAWYIQTMND